MTLVSVRRQGNGHAIKIPKHIADQLNITVGSKLEATVLDGKIMLSMTQDAPSTLLKLLDSGNKNPK